MAELLKKGHYADEIMQILADEEKERLAETGRDKPNPNRAVDKADLEGKEV